MARLVREAAAQGAIYVQTPEMTGALQRDRAALKAVLRDEADDLIVAARVRACQGTRHLICMSARRRSRLTTARSPIAAFCSGRMAAIDHPLRQDPHVRRRSRQWRELARKRGLYARAAGAAGRPALRQAGLCHLLRCALSRSFSGPQAVAGAEIMTVPAAFTRQTGEAHWEILLRARAIENGVFVIAAAQAGVHEDGRETFGHSMIIDPWGRVLASAGGTGEAVIVADIDIAAVAAARDENSQPEECAGSSRSRRCRLRAAGGVAA